MKLRTIVIEDDPLATLHLTQLIRDDHSLQFEGSFTNADSALAYLEAHEVDLIFLDVRLPGVDGFEFLRNSSTSAEVIVVSAEKTNAAEAFEFDVRRFLHKPIAPEQFTDAVAAVRITIASRGEAAPADHIYIKADHGYRRIDYAELAYVESRRDYALFQLRNARHLVRARMKDVEDALSNHPSFFRCHRSYIINLAMLEYFNAGEVQVMGRLIPMANVNYTSLQRLVNML